MTIFELEKKGSPKGIYPLKKKLAPTDLNRQKRRAKKHIKIIQIKRSRHTVKRVRADHGYT